MNQQIEFKKKPEPKPKSPRREPGERATGHLHANVPPSLITRVDAFVAANRTYKNEVIRIALEEFLARFDHQEIGESIK